MQIEVFMFFIVKFVLYSQTNAEREGPYIALGHLINEMWPIETWNQVISVPDCSGPALSNEYSDGDNAVIDLSTED
jgi:hypothetical protein